MGVFARGVVTVLRVMELSIEMCNVRAGKIGSEIQLAISWLLSGNQLSINM